MMIQAILKEHYIYSDQYGPRQGVKEEILETRYFSSEEKFKQWYNTFKDKLWEDTPGSKDLCEGIFIEKHYLPVDNMAPPKELQKHATFRKGVSRYYANIHD